LLLLKIRQLGYKVVMVGGTSAFHCDRLTKVLGQSSLTQGKLEQDVKRWCDEYPHYAADEGVAWIDVSRHPFSTRSLASFLWRLAGQVTSKKWGLAVRIRTFIMWLEPFLTRYPGA
jgi:hypothetical protein